MRARLSHAIQLARVRVFSFKDLWLFILAVIFISMTSAAIGAFVSGMRPAEFFLGDAEDIFVITQPEASTPMTGNVPESLIEDLIRIPGVESASAEILGVVIAQNLNDESIIVRGITRAFSELTNISIVEGKWFDQYYSGETNSSTSYGAVAGIKLAENKKLSVGSKVTLVSTLAAMTLEVTIEGIASTGIHGLDSELILPLITARAITGRSSGQATFVRVKVDLQILSIPELKQILNSEYQVPVKVHCKNPLFNDKLEGEPVLVYDSAGIVREAQNLNADHTATFRLPFGAYRLVATPSFTEQSEPLEVFTTPSMPELFTLYVGKQPHELTVSVSYNNQPAFNASVHVENPWEINASYTGFTSQDGNVTFPHLNEDYYKIETSFKNIVQTDSLELNSTWQHRVNFTNTLKLHVFDALLSSIIINGGSIQLLNPNNSSEILYPSGTTNNRTVSYDSGDILYIENPGNYLINYTNGNRKRLWNQEISGNTTIKLYFGIGRLKITVFDSNGELLENCNVEIRNETDQIIDSKVTGNEALVRFDLETGFDYTIITKHPITNTTKIFPIHFERNTELNLNTRPIEKYYLEIEAYNGTSEHQIAAGLAGCTISVYNTTSIVNTAVTNNSGKVSIELDQAGKYNITALYLDYSWEKEFNIGISQEITNVRIPLGKVKLKITAKTSSNNTIEGLFISVTGLDGFYENASTNTNGNAIFLVPLGNYTIKTEIVRYEKEVPLSFEESQIYLLETQLDLAATLNIRVRDSAGYPIPGVMITAKNKLFRNKITGVTNEKAEITFENLRWGNYSGRIMSHNINESIFFTFAKEKELIQINLTITIPTSFLSDSSALLKWRGQININVVQSAQFLSGFLTTTLQVVETTFSALLIVIAGLSLLSVSSVISHPISTHSKNLYMIKTVGGTNKQIKYIVAIQLTIIGLIACFLGAWLGTMIITYWDWGVNIGGLIIEPTANFDIIIGIAIASILVVTIKSRQTVQNILEDREAELMLRQPLGQVKAEEPQITMKQRVQKFWAEIKTNLPIKRQFQYIKPEKHQFILLQRSKFLSPFIIVSVFSIIIHIPLIPNVTGADGFQVLWQAQQILLGNANSWLIHPLSFFGLFTFSGYPIGAPLIVSFLLFITGGNMLIVAYLYVLGYCLGSSYTSILMMKEFSDDPLEIIIGGVIYSSIPILLRFTYFSTTARAPFLVLAPLLFVYLNRWRVNRRIWDLIRTLIVLFGLFLFHRMALAFPIFFIVTLFFVFWEQIISIIAKRREKILPTLLSLHSRVLILFVWPVLYIWGIINPIVPSNFIDNLGLSLKPQKLNSIFQEASDFGMAWGIVLFFVFIIVINAMTTPQNPTQNENRMVILYLLFLFTPFILALNNPTYVSFVLIPILMVLGAKGFVYVLSMRRLRSFYSWILGTSLVLSWTFIYLTIRSIPLFLLIFYTLAVLLFSLPFIKKISAILRPSKPFNQRQITNLFLIFFLLAIVAHSFVLVQARLTVPSEETFPKKYISNEEILTAKFLRSQGTGFFSAYSQSDLETRIAAYSGWLCFETSGISFLISGVLENDSVIQNSSLLPMNEWFKQYIFEFHYEEPLYEKTLRTWRTLLTSEFDSTLSRAILTVTQLKYFITSSNDSIAVDSDNNEFFSPFIETMRLSNNSVDPPYARNVFETTHLTVWEINI